MINNDNTKNKTQNNNLQKKDNIDSVPVEDVKFSVVCHLIIKEKDTGKVLINKRG